MVVLVGVRVECNACLRSAVETGLPIEATGTGID